MDMGAFLIDDRIIALFYLRRQRHTFDVMQQHLFALVLMCFK